MVDFQSIRRRFTNATKAALITDSNVDRHYGDAAVRALEETGIAVERIVFPAGEKSKSISTYVELVNGLAALGIGRSDVMISLGGGTVSDLTGFAAATYMRGIRWVAIPTTLLAMVDAVVGGKTGVNLEAGKNLAGAFWRCEFALRDFEYLRTLPEVELKNGYAEMLKMAILFEPTLIPRIRDDLEFAVERCVQLKEAIVAEDFHDHGKRQLLNLGHTFGHAIERVSNYHISHGEAIALGMRIVAREVPEIGEALDAFGFMAREFSAKDKSRILEFIANDKKRVGVVIKLVVPRRIGECEIREVPLKRLGEWL